MRIATGLFGLVLVGCIVAPAALAADVDEATALAEEITKFRKADEVIELTLAVEKVPAMYAAVEDKTARGKLMGVLGDVVGDKDAATARIAAVIALVELEDPKGAWKEISRQMPTAKVEEATDLDVAIVKAAGDLAQSRAIRVLIELLEKAKDNNLAKEAAISLGGFGADKRQRVKVLDELVSIGKKIRPGYSTEKQVSEVARERWQTVGPGIVQGLNRLTGRQLGSFEDWELLYEDNKKRLKNLFEESE